METIEEAQQEKPLQDQLHEQLMYYPEEIDEFPLNFETISQEQQNDPKMLPLANLDNHEIQLFNRTKLICKHHNNQWVVFLPTNLVQPTIQWYHLVLGHVGINQLYNTLKQHLWIPNMKEIITSYVNTCNHCQ